MRPRSKPSSCALIWPAAAAAQEPAAGRGPGQRRDARAARGLLLAGAAWLLLAAPQVHALGRGKLDSHTHATAGAGGTALSPKTFNITSTSSSTFNNVYGLHIATPSANALSSNNLIQAWVLFVGTGTVQIQAGFGVSAVVDAGVGLYDVYFSRPFISASGYAVTFSWEIVNAHACQVNERAANRVRVRCNNTASDVADMDKVSVIAVGRTQ